MIGVFYSAAVPVEKPAVAGPVPAPRPKTNTPPLFEPSRPAPPRPQPMPRTKSAYDVSGDDFSALQPKSIPRNQSETNLEQRRDLIPTLSNDSLRATADGCVQPVSSDRCPSLPSLERLDSVETSASLDADTGSMPPPQSLPPSLPPGYGREPPPVPCSRPVGSLPAPVPPARPAVAPDNVIPPLPGSRPPVVNPVGVVSTQQPLNGDEEETPAPYIPPRPKAAPVGLPPAVPSTAPAPAPVIPARSVPPPIPSRTPVGAPQVPPRQ